MTAPKHTADVEIVLRLLLGWIEAHADEDGFQQFRKKREEVASEAPEWRLFTAFSGVPRFLGKTDLELGRANLTAANEARPGWDPSGWSIDQAGRTALVISYPYADPDAYVQTLDKIFSTADVGESVALYQSLPLLPHPERFRSRAAEGVRSNITSVLNAVALDNPYPSEYLDDDAWNQMVLKAVFVGSPLYRIRGLDERANPKLARMLVDYAHERWAASRSVTPELWRPVGPFVDGGYAEELALVLDSSDDTQREAAALALHDASSEHARRLLDKEPDLKERVDRGDLTWESFSRNRVPV